MERGARLIPAICLFEGDITNVKLQYHFDLHRSDITKLLQDLCKNGYLISDNKSRWTTYRLNTEFRVNEVNPNVDSSNVDSSNVDSSNEESSNEDSSNVDSSNVDSSNEDTSETKDQSARTRELYHLIQAIFNNIRFQSATCFLSRGTKNGLHPQVDRPNIVLIVL